MKRFIKGLLCLGIGLSISACGGNSSEEENKTKEIKLDNVEFKDKNYNEVYQDLEDLGFTNIVGNSLDDLSSQDKDKDQKVEEVLIDDKTPEKDKTYSSDDEIKITYHKIKMVYPPFDYDDLPEDLMVDDAIAQFEESGFTNIKRKPMGDLSMGLLHDEGEVETIVVGGNEEFTNVNAVSPDTEVTIEYHSYKEEKAAEDAQSEGIINASNNSEFAEILQIKDPFDARIQSFANTHVGQNIEYDGNVTAISRHGKYKTRYDYSVYAGNYGEDIYGPMFFFENVAYYDFNLIGDYIPDSLVEGTNIHIVAKIVEYDPQSGLFKLDPVSTSVR